MQGYTLVRTMAVRFEQLIDRHHDELFAYVWRLLGKERHTDIALEVEDLVQEVFLRAYESYGRLRPDSNLRAWLFKIATNCTFTKLRRLKKWRRKALDLKGSVAKSGFPSGRVNLPSRIRTLVGTLPAKQKACLTLRYLQDLDYAEIAGIVNCSEASARANVYQAIQRLRLALREDL